MKHLAFIAGLVLSQGIAARGQLFLQDFSSSSTVSDFVNATPNHGQFNAIGSSGAGVTVVILGGALQFTRAALNSGSFSRTTDFAPVPDALKYQFDLTISGNLAAQTTAAAWAVGSGFGTANSDEANANTYAKFGVNFTSTPGDFSIRDITGPSSSATFSGTQTISWFLNNSGAAISYTSLASGTETISNDRADIWVGAVKVFDDVEITTPSQTITDLKFVFDEGSGTIAMDNFLIDTITPVPEPEEYALVVGLGLLGFALYHRRMGKSGT